LNMRFDYENQMVEPAEAWLKSKGLMVKREFSTPWGICDLVGCSFNRHNVKKRLRLGQVKPIGPHFRVMLLSHIPDEAENRPITAHRLVTRFSDFFDEAQVMLELDRLQRDRFVQRTPSGSFYKVNGWAPLHKRLIAVELKLSRITEVLHQAIGHLEFADESYVGLPMATAKRLIAAKRKMEFIQAGVGILGIDATKCRILLKSGPSKNDSDGVIQAHCVERFWRTSARGS
jgi:hypothetical protein